MMRISIRPDEFLAGEDAGGRLFIQNGSLFRGVRASQSALHRRLLSGWMQTAVENYGLVATEVTNYVSDEFDLIVRHRIVEPETFPFEWPGQMLKEAALFFCRFARKTAALGVGLKDAHGYNILFDFQHRPHFIDLCSLVPLEQTRGAIHPEFRRYFLNPLYLMRSGRAADARHLINLGGYETGSKRGGVDDELVIPHMISEERDEYIAARRHEASLRGNGQFYELIGAYEREINAINPDYHKSCWSSYYDASARYPTNQRFSSLDPDPSWQPKQRHMFDLFRTTAPCRVLDVGCAAGWFSRLAASHGHQVIALDNDEAAITRLLADARAAKLAIMPLACEVSRMGDLYPSDGHKNIGRFRADIVLAGAILHHLVFKARMSFEAIVDLLAGLTSSVLVLEYLDDADDSIRAFRRDEDVLWYRPENIRPLLESRFQKIEVVPSTEGMERFLFVCRQPVDAPLIESARQEGCCAAV